MPSSVIRNFRYHPDERRLSVVFTSGRHYVYLGVPPKVAHAFTVAPSKGEFFNAHIRDHFDFERLR